MELSFYKIKLEAKMSEERKAQGVIVVVGVPPRKFIDFAINVQEHLDSAEWDISAQTFMVDYIDLEPVETYLKNHKIEHEVYPFSEHPELAILD